jgi:hypothetical protein
VTRLAGPPGRLGPLAGDAGDPLDDDDLQLALYTCYELHYEGFEGVDERWEWEPSLIAARGRLERAFETRLLDEVPRRTASPVDLDRRLRDLVARDTGPSLSRWIESRAALEHVREFAVHRSAYQLKEADPHSWAIPRLRGRAKAALVEIQSDEYGGGSAERMHASLFGGTLDGLGLDSRYGAYLDHLPGVTLATVNLMSLFGLHRRWRGALVGHLAAFEMTSSEPNRRYARGLRRLGVAEPALAFYDEHVEADAVHEVIAVHDLACSLAEQEPALAADILFGAEALLVLDARFAGHVIAAWSRGESSLRRPLRQPIAAA